MKLPSFPWQSETARGLAMAVVFALAGLAIGILLIPAPPPRVDIEAPAPNFRMLGQRVPLDEHGEERVRELLRKFVSGDVEIQVPGGLRHLIPASSLGARIERGRLASLLEQIRRPTSPLRLGLPPDVGTVDLPVPVRLDPARAFDTLLALKDAVDKVPQDARIDLSARKLVPEQAGIQLDVFATYARIEEALRSGKRKVEAKVEIIQPRLKASQLGNVKFDHVLGYFETNYARGGRHRLRTYNLRLAASRLDGHVVLPGEIFDFNEVVGPRDEAHGYKKAPVIAEGELVDGIGGGTCQISGTLHAAAYFAGMEIVDRTPHTRPSTYIKMGLDAAVSYPAITLKLRNNFSFPVVLHETVKGGVVRAEILGPKRKLTVTYVRKIVKIMPYTEKERKDPKLPAGVRVLSQRGVPGFRVKKYRIVRDGPFAVRTLDYDTYPPTTQIIRVGTGSMPRDSVKVHDDPHPEYTVDEYLVITQGPGVHVKGDRANVPGGPMVEQRVPGKTGERGWMEKMGFPIYHSQNEHGDSDRNKRERKRNRTRKKRKR